MVSISTDSEIVIPNKIVQRRYLASGRGEVARTNKWLETKGDEMTTNLQEFRGFPAK